ncbi:MAG: LytTR family DNA-binding domain-containing protein [Bacteroidota bacterium]
MLKCIAIDDEPKGLDIIKKHVQRLNSIELIATYLDPFEAISYLNEHEVDLIFLDINMPSINGVELVKSLTCKPMVIFTTAHSEYAMDSYEVKALDYLLKPFDFSRFLMAVNKAQDALKDRLTTDDFIFVNTGNQKKRIVFDDVLYIEGEGNYVKYIFESGNTMVRSTVKNTLQVLPKSKFVQIHRSYIIPFSKIEKVEDSHVYISDKRLPVSSSFREEFMNLINRYNPLV